MKISVLTIAYRPGYLDSLVQALRDQTLPKGDWEWLLIDDLYELRREAACQYIGDSFQFRHIPPREIRPYSATCVAINTGLVHAQGECVFFMADYTFAHPRCLERHWEIYQRYGPKVFISGPLIDGITLTGQSVWTGAEPMMTQVKVGEELITYPEHSPPIPWPLKKGYETPGPDNLISIFERPFQLAWPVHLPTDWRLGAISNISLAKGLYEAADPRFWWMGRNDSAPLDVLLELNGLDETQDGLHGGMEASLAREMMRRGYRYLVDRETPCYVLPHPTRKRELKREELPKDRVRPNLRKMREESNAHDQRVPDKV